MGRYAFFNTDLEFKFRFGVQPSSDIRMFGGRVCHEHYIGADFHHEWEQHDKEYIKEQLQYLLEWLGVDPVDFELYEKNLEGTYQLKFDLGDLYKEYSEEIVCRYILGCCIYHQLLYIDKLEVAYEGWT
jgi:hypothetical protein